MSLRFLIVDDTKFMRKMLTDILKDLHYEVVGEADNGTLAVQMFRKLRPDVTFLDIYMPEVDGIEAMRQIRAIDPGAIVIVCSGTSQQYLISDAMRLGANGYVMKPFKPKQILEAIQKFVLPNLPARVGAGQGGQADRPSAASVRVSGEETAPEVVRPAEPAEVHVFPAEPDRDAPGADQAVRGEEVANSPERDAAGSDEPSPDAAGADQAVGGGADADAQERDAAASDEPSPDAAGADQAVGGGADADAQERDAAASDDEPSPVAAGPDERIQEAADAEGPARDEAIAEEAPGPAAQTDASGRVEAPADAAERADEPAREAASADEPAREFAAAVETAAGTPTADESAADKPDGTGDEACGAADDGFVIPVPETVPVHERSSGELHGLKDFKSCISCRWKEDVDDREVIYQVSWYEGEPYLRIGTSMNGEELVLSFDGLRHLLHWLNRHAGPSAGARQNVVAVP